MNKLHTCEIQLQKALQDSNTTIMNPDADPSVVIVVGVLLVLIFLAGIVTLMKS